jgi:hypothetical protein
VGPASAAPRSPAAPATLGWQDVSLQASSHTVGPVVPGTTAVAGFSSATRNPPSFSAEAEDQILRSAAAAIEFAASAAASVAPMTRRSLQRQQAIAAGAVARLADAAMSQSGSRPASAVATKRPGPGGSAGAPVAGSSGTAAWRPSGRVRAAHLRGKSQSPAQAQAQTRRVVAVRALSVSETRVGSDAAAPGSHARAAPSPVKVRISLASAVAGTQKDPISAGSDPAASSPAWSVSEASMEVTDLQSGEAPLSPVDTPGVSRFGAGIASEGAGPMELGPDSATGTPARDSTDENMFLRHLQS